MNSGGAEFVVDEVEKVANVVENVATVAEKASEEVAKKFPDPEDGKIKKACFGCRTCIKTICSICSTNIEVHTHCSTI